ncbi:hypothetical protein FPV67DRAFT_1447586 [Lyophyllum atratum]|nr:hypothetical protein FPV67DRAFT_1447586 [Lyophyllum atratum]
MILDDMASATYLQVSTTSAYLVKTIYRITWEDFYVWEQDHCLRTLHSLARSFPQGIPQTEKSISRLRSSVPLPVFSSPLEDSQSSDTDDESFTIMDHTHGSRKPRITTVSAKVVDITRPIEPCAAYEACTPTNRNINVGDDSEYMPFIPLIDEPNFNFLLHAGDYKYFDWQVQNRDPDLQVILKQTVHTLHNVYKLSLQDIEKTGILPQSALSNLLPASRRRDFPKWRNISSPLPYVPSHAEAGPSKTLSNLVNDFCNNANCVIGYCTVHLGDMPAPEAIPPIIPTNALADSVDAPCGAQCFLRGKALAMGTYWSAEDIELLTTILSFSPDLAPCDLATICRNPCQEASRPARPLAHQLQGTHFLIMENVLLLTRRKSPRPRRRIVYTASAGGGDANAPSLSSKAGSISHAKSRGAHAIARTGSAIPNSASNAKPDASSDICKNACIQRGIPKRTEVRQSAWGLELYIAEEAKEEEFVIEYTGELVYEVTSICRDTKAGNESRFINHDPKNANCHAGDPSHTRSAIGERRTPRIGLFTLSALSPGTELLLNYGDSFFQREGDEAPEGERPPNAPASSLEQVVYTLDQHSSDETYSD